MFCSPFSCCEVSGGASVKCLSPEHSTSAKGQERCSQRQNRLVCISLITLGQLQARHWTSCLFFFAFFGETISWTLTSSLLHASLKTKISSVFWYVYHLDLELETPGSKTLLWCLSCKGHAFMLHLFRAAKLFFVFMITASISDVRDDIMAAVMISSWKCYLNPLGAHVGGSIADSPQHDLLQNTIKDDFYLNYVL